MTEDDKYHQLLTVSNPITVQKKLNEYLPGTQLYLSTRRTKKYMIQQPNGKWSHFGDILFQDFTKHKDKDRRRRYIQRASNIRGNWINDPYSSNMLSICLLWN